MRGDSAIWRACIGGRPDWYGLAGECDARPDDVRERAIQLGAWWFIQLEPADIARGDKAIRAGLPPAKVAEAMGTDVHRALILMGLRAGYGGV